MMTHCGCGKSLKSDGGNPDPRRVETPIFSPQSTLYQLFRKDNQHLANHFPIAARYKLRTPQTHREHTMRHLNFNPAEHERHTPYTLHLTHPLYPIKSTVIGEDETL
jgi:hypothetical protein